MDKARPQSEGAEPGILRGASSAAVVGGAAGSVGLVLDAGRRNPSWPLMALFTIWVVSPFAILAWAHFASKPRSIFRRRALNWVTPVIALSSLAIYEDVAVGHPRVKAAPYFLMVPAASWLLIAIVLAAESLISRRRSRRV